jgi:hypothetical protein
MVGFAAGDQFQPFLDDSDNATSPFRIPMQA